MGCDIHPYLEVHDKETGQWVVIERLESSRNYLWFGIIAGVRNEKVQCIDTPRGLPADASLLVQRQLGDDDNRDLHSHSYITLKEISQAWRIFLYELRNNGKDELEILTDDVINNKPSYYDMAHKKEPDGSVDWIPILNQMRWYGDLDEDLNLTLEDAWYDDMRYVFAFDN